MFDTRPAPHTVGARTSPLGPDETYDISGRGDQGDCELPEAGVGLVLNVTAVDATQGTFLTLFPTGEDRPTASHLNPSPGAPPAPNAVTVDLSTSGEFSVFNRFGTVHVLADVVGYYTDHHHDDRYYTEAEVDAAIADALASLPPTYSQAEVDSLLVSKADTSALGGVRLLAHGYMRADTKQFFGTGADMTYNAAVKRYEFTLDTASFGSGDFAFAMPIENQTQCPAGTYTRVSFNNGVLYVYTRNAAGSNIDTCGFNFAAWGN